MSLVRYTCSRTRTDVDSYALKTKRSRTASRSLGVRVGLRDRCAALIWAEDQQRINQFSKYNTRLGDIEDQLKVKRVSDVC
jgi:hypothetical protein